MSDRSFLFWGLTGFIAGLLLAPKSGKETRENMRTYYFEMKDKILENLAQIKDITKDTYENVVNSVVKGYEEAKLVTSGEASQIRSELKDGYTRIKTILSVPEEKEK